MKFPLRSANNRLKKTPGNDEPKGNKNRSLQFQVRRFEDINIIKMSENSDCSARCGFVRHSASPRVQNYPCKGKPLDPICQTIHLINPSINSY